ncbi:DNA repair protein RecN [Xylophilus ampelinus]|uniref:DNA repair protein RecN n=1 Tax=Xylophilus ampelinus TaxID=54067 RepID=A0A318SJM5_9BURK|nr:DNA repair protein RecN [Xylophilus ampelinus]MCS4509365.1 DNA repair protein RecN [Xylophilus ampelinus]PYE79087.1 DNA replication and repair protein RecN [Xylophilus ampelinus]
MALKRISLRDFVIVRALELDLSGGFSALTGETGAGKSILVDALQLALGSRADASVVREGAARAEISTEFDTPAALGAWLDAAGFEPHDPLLLRRTIDAQGKSRAWINGSPATAGQLREVGEQLLDIHGQHAWQSLTRPDAVRGLLDAYAGADTRPLAGLWQTWRSAVQALENARTAQESLHRERERLSWQIGEVQKLAPAADEWDELNGQHTRLSHAQALIDGAQGALTALEEDERGATESLSRSLALLQDQQHLEPEFAELCGVLSSALAQAEDAAHSLHAYLRKTDPDPQQLASLDERMGLWMSLARRYRRPPEELPALLAGWREELARLNAAADLAALEKAERTAAAAFQAEAATLSKARARAAPRLSREITQAMQGLGMNGGRFEVALQKSAQASAHGLEDVHFMVAGHAGSTPRPVAKVASGGELSRLALAIAVTTSALGSADTLIFDEVDAGVGGTVAETVGRLMQQLGRDRQVLAVTHLPQVASCADHHLVVAKQRDADGTTSSSVAVVEGEARVAEVSRMLGGERQSVTSMAHAREMLERRDMPPATPATPAREPA